MEFSEDSIDRTLVFKGKRSKRPRQFMAVAVVTSTSSTACDGGAGGGARGSDGGVGGEIYYSSPTTSTTQISSSSTEEDEDMANCLILLAQSGRCHEKLQQVESTERKMMKISSRKFTEMATTTTGKAGFYVYECKTCNRTFPSFQALGGHRTSHKKIKIVTEEKKSTADSNSQSQGHHHQHQQQEKFTPSVNPTGNSNSVTNLINSKPKIHECSICGAEFSSGQALGGHMRRHRPPTITATTTNTKITVDETSNTSDNSSHDNNDENSKENNNKPKIFLSLDLNLPASPEDDQQQRDANFEFSANQQKLMFTAAALVDCHY